MPISIPDQNAPRGDVSQRKEEIVKESRMFDIEMHGSNLFYGGDVKFSVRVINDGLAVIQYFAIPDVLFKQADLR